MSFKWISNIDGEIGNSIFFTNYLSANNHIIVLEVNDGKGGTDKSEVLVIVNSLPKAVIDYPETDSLFLTSQSIVFDASSSYDLEDDLSYIWVSNIDGVIGNTVNFDKKLSSGIHTITLNIEDKQGGVDFSVITLVINTPPNAIIASPSENELFFVEDEIIFDAYSSYDRDNDDLYYTWTSNIDGEIYSGKYNGFRKRLNAGHHMIELTLDDGRGGIDKELINININTPPIIIIDSPSNYSKFSNSEIVNFIASSSYDSDGDNLEFSWFSSIDGNLGNVGEIGEILSEGTHTIILRVEDKYGSFDEETLIVNIVQDEINEENNAISQNDKESNNNIYFIVIPLIATMIFVVLGFAVWRKGTSKDWERDEEFE